MSATRTWQEWATDASIDFWHCVENAETLTHEWLEEAVEAYVDEYSGLREDLEGWVRSWCANGLKVYGHRRKAVDPDWLRSEAERLAERFFEESWCEEYGNMHERDRAAEANLATAFREALKDNLPEAWQCERVVTVTIPLDELLPLLRERCLNWFEEES